MVNKKELIRQYKQKAPEMGIFQIKNKTNGKIFIGKAKDIKGKINSNRFQLENGMHSNKVLQQDYNTVGKENIDIEILDYLKLTDDPGVDYSEELNILEEMWLEKLEPYGEKGYNTRKKQLILNRE